MAIIGEATIEIDMVAFWEFVEKHHPKFDEVVYGVPRVNKSNGTLEIDVAFGYGCHPTDWAVKSKAEEQRKELK